MFLSILNKTCADNASHKARGRNLSQVVVLPDPGSPSFMLRNMTLSSKGLKELHPFPTWMVREKGRNHHSYCLYKDSPKPNHHSQLARHWTRWKQSFPSAWTPPVYHSVLLKMQTLQQQGRQAQHGRTAGSEDTNTGSLTCTHNLVPHAFISVSYIPQVFWRRMPLHLPMLHKMQEKRLHVEATGSGFGSWSDTTEFFSFHTMYLTQNPLSKRYKVTLISVWLLIPNSKDF